MIKALLKHIQLLLLFKHNGEGLKTEKSFTFILLFLCLFVSLYSDQSLDTLTLISNIVLFIVFYVVTKKEVINGVLLCILVFLVVNLFLPRIGLLVLLWVFFAMTHMQNNYRNKN